MINEKPENKLNEEVKQMEIAKYIDNKYESRKLVSTRTIQRWLKEFGINCIEPRPKKNADIRYKKSDVIKLVENKNEDLIRKKNAGKFYKEFDKEKEELAREIRRMKIEVNEIQSNLTEDEIHQEEIDSIFDYSKQASDIIAKEKLEMCFNQLFPDTIFDQEHLERLLLTTHEDSMYSELEVGEAIIELQEKRYIKN